MKGARQRRKADCILWATYSTQSRHKFVGSPIRRLFLLSRLLVSKPHKKSCRLHEHCLTPDLCYILAVFPLGNTVQ